MNKVEASDKVPRWCALHHGGPGQPSLSPSLMSWLPDLFSFFLCTFWALFIFWEKILFLLWLSDDRRQRFRRERCPPRSLQGGPPMMRFFLTVMAAMTLPLEYMLPPSVYVIQRACITVNLPVIISCCCHRKSTTRKLGERKHTHTHMLTFLGVFSFSAGRTRDH
jgi:hypothetical protein